MDESLYKKITLNIDFDELLTAFMQSSVSKHFFIDTEKNELIYINDEVDRDSEEKIEEMENKKYLMIPIRLPKDDLLIMEIFIYEIVEEDFKLADEFYKVLDSRKAFGYFRELLDKYPEIKEKWFKFKDKEIKNQTINWLGENNIVLENQKLIPNIEIKELSENEKLPKEIGDFGPIACMDCNNKGIKGRFFEINIKIENILIDSEIKRIMEEKYQINNFGVFSTGVGTILTAAKCPKCGSENIFWDF